MILDKNTKDKPDITYPTDWGFKLIGRDKNELEKCIKEIMGGKEHQCRIGNVSKGGKFHSYNANCIVDTKEERDRLFGDFEKHNAVNMVI